MSRRVDLTAHHEHAVELAGLDQALGDAQPVEEAAALGAQVHARRLPQSEGFVDEEGAAREIVLR